MRPTDRAERLDPGTFLAKIDIGKTELACKSKQVIFNQGDPADAVLYVKSGRVKITVVSARGKEAVVAVLGRGSFFGEGCLTGQPLRVSTASAVQLSSVVRVDRPAMMRALRDEPRLAAGFLAYMLSRNARIEEDLVDQLFNSSEKRLARVLLLLANFGEESQPDSVIPRLSQETLAAMVGTTRSRVNHFMNRFRRKGFIDYKGTSALRINAGLLTILLRD